MNVSTEVLSVLEAAQVVAPDLVKLTGQLDPKLYKATDKVLQAIGGAWNRKRAGHVFEVDAAEAIEAVLQTGVAVNRRQQFQFFETPADVAKRLIETAGVCAGMRVLEPSAGQGAIVRWLPQGLSRILAVELDLTNATKLTLSMGMHNLGLSGPELQVRVGDFMQLPPDPTYGAVVMNPPFAGQADIDHVRRAYEWLAPGGHLAAVMSGSTAWRQNRKAVEFRAWAEQITAEHPWSRPWLSPLPDGSFKASGTDVQTCIVHLRA